MLARLDEAGLDRQIDALAEVLVACVAGGASVGFMQPLRGEQARAYWRGLAPGIAAGRIRLLAWLAAGRAAGTVQLHLATPPNQAHRGEIAKLLVHPAARRQGVAGALLAAAEGEALALGRDLLTLDTISGSAAARLYQAAGWSRVGEIPDFARMPHGPLAPTTIFYKRLRRDAKVGA